MKKLLVVLAAAAFAAPLSGCASRCGDGYGSRLLWWRRPAAVECAPVCDPCAGGPVLGGDTYLAPSGVLPGPIQQ